VAATLPASTRTLTPLERSLLFSHRPPGRRPAGLRGYGTMNPLQGAADFTYALFQPTTIAPVLGGLVLGLGSRIALGRGPARTAAGVAALGGFAFGGWSFYRSFRDARAATADYGAAAAGKRVGESVAATAREAAAQPGMSDVQMSQVLKSYSCYENARRAKADASWYEKLTGTGGAVRNPLIDCGLTAEQLADVKAAFNKISRTDRRRLMPGTFGPGGPLEDLG